MKKRTIISLGICALAFGAVTNAIGVQKTSEVRADEVTAPLKITLEMTGHDSSTMQGPQFAYKTASASGHTCTYFASSEDKWTLTLNLAPGEYFCHIALWGNADPWPEYDIYGGDDGADFALTLTEAGGRLSVSGLIKPKAEKSKGTFTFEDGSENPDGWYMVGSMNGWKQNDTYYTDGYDAGNVAKWIGINLTANDTFAFAYSNFDALDWEQAKRFAAKSGGGAGDLFVNAQDGDQNIKVTATGCYDIYMTNAYQLSFEVHQEPDVPAEDGYYLLGNEQYAGEGKAFKFAGGKKMGAGTGTDKAKLENVEIKAGDAVKARSYLESTDTWYTAGKTKDDENPYSFATVDDDGNYVFTKNGTYSFFLNAEGKLWIDICGDPAKHIDDDRYLYISTGPFLTTFVYSWTDEDPEQGILFTQNAEFPGVKLENCAPNLTFNSAGSIHKFQANNLYANFKVSLWTVDGEGKPDVKQHETGNFTSRGAVYVNAMNDGSTTLQEGAVLKQATAAYDLAVAIDGTTRHSVCEISKETAVGLAEAYVGLGEEKSLFDAATIYTYNGNYKPAEMPATSTNFALSAIMVQVNRIAYPEVNSSWNINGLGGNATLVITISILTVGFAAAAAMFIVSRKRRLQK